MTTEHFADGRILLEPGRIARLLINSPEKRNALSRAMWAGIGNAVALIADDPGIRVVILAAVQGDGPPAFSTGADISEFDAVYADDESTRAYNAQVRAAQAVLRDLPRPVIAMISGACVGGGCGLALAADLRFADTSALFGITPSRLGLAYSPEDTAQLLEKVGPAMAKDILFSARLLDAEEARTVGLADRVFAPDQLEAETLAYAEKLASLSSGSIRTAKAVVNALANPQPADMSALRVLFEQSFTSADFAEGRVAFLEKRKPDFD